MRFFIIIGLLISLFIPVLPAKAAVIKQQIDVTDRAFYYIEFDPRTIFINQGDTLDLYIDNDARTDVRVFIPIFGIDQIVPKRKKARLVINVTDPPSSVIWFQISSAKKGVTGYIIVRAESHQ